MTTRTLPALALAAALVLGASRAAADDPKLPDTRTFDKLVVDTLRDVHNKGADLYNTSKDYAGAHRLYEGALATVRPLLAHRPEAQKLIDAGLAAAEKEPEAARKAFVLHEAIEGVRKNLKAALAEPKKTAEPPKKPDEPKKTTEEPKKPTEPPKKPDEKKPTEPPKKPDDKKPDDKKPIEPPKKPEDKKPVEPPKKTEEPKKAPEPPKKPDEPKKPDDKKPAEPPKKVEEKKPEEKKPDGAAVAVAPMPKNPVAKADGAASVRGTITRNGQPVIEGEVTFVSLNQPLPRVFTGAIKNGAYNVTEAIPAGQYAGMVTGKGVPEKYHLIATAGLRFEFAAGANTADIALK